MSYGKYNVGIGGIRAEMKKMGDQNQTMQRRKY